ncbi:hypothetical protein NUITMVS1_36320 [Shewanella xiamenensis]|nr:hypothetical protein NUITMVS1_36320 [Shewanella xiamenensis]
MKKTRDYTRLTIVNQIKNLLINQPIDHDNKNTTFTFFRVEKASLRKVSTVILALADKTIIKQTSKEALYVGP